MRDMLRVGRDRLLDRGRVRGLDYAQLDAEALPFPDKSFDCVTMAFGLRNVTHKERALAEIHRVLKIGGRALMLEFSRVRAEFLKPLYDFHSFEVLPRIGKLDRRRRGELSLSRRVDPQASGSGRR